MRSLKIWANDFFAWLSWMTFKLIEVLMAEAFIIFTVLILLFFYAPRIIAVIWAMICAGFLTVMLCYGRYPRKQ